MSFRIRGLIAYGIVLLLFAQPATASGATPAPCCVMTQTDGCDMCGEWAAGAQALYFTPITCPYAYASTVVGTDTPGLSTLNGRAQVIPCRTDWGFRIFGNYLHDRVFAGLSYQWFEVTTTRAVTAESLHIQGSGNFASGRATGQVGIEYQNIDVRMGKYLLQGCHSTIYWYGNARWIDLSHSRSARVFFTTPGFLPEDAQEKSQFEGGALGIGFGGEFNNWCGVGAFIDGNILGVIGKRSLKDVRFRGFQLEPILGNTLLQRRESYPSETCVIPEIDFRIGVNYTYVCGCWELVGEIGYEVDYFWHASVFPDRNGTLLVTGPTEFAPVCQDLGFSGLFFGARLIF